MVHRKTHKRRHHSKRKSSRRTHTRRTHRRRTHRRGGRAVPLKNRNESSCQNLLDRFHNIEADLNNQTAETIEDFYGEVRSFYDEVEDAARLNQSCHYLLGLIDAFENGPLKDKMDELLGN